ncbi:hypothetical protein ACDP63_15285 [Paracoccus sp. P2]|mgnify:CR=1 FL=1|uniref:Uncharacterized protein n=2 Tax=Paracoccus pantotrophus TaxID=82367 RepID=A0A7H9BN51_PARPN|nr:hypothetical protein [Paracoccus pantotrophus]MDF3855143.1 hypothetical protein [Paracoccus pantotrophus]QLH12737.1 hypothetical protein HYQ43_04135 [Paracoccus pantotrophus]
MQLGEGLPDLPSCGRQDAEHLFQVRQGLDEILHSRFKPSRINSAHLEAKVAQQGAVLLAGYGLHMQRAIQIDTHHLGDPARVVAVDLVHLRLEESLGVARLDADRRKAGLGQALGQPLG